MINSVMSITNARKAFGGNEVLKDISLEAVSYTHLTLPTKQRV